MVALVTTLFLGLLGQLSYGAPIEEASDIFSGRIVGGVDADSGYARHMVALVFGQIVISQLCGGSIISKHLVLTAAHCIDPYVTWEGNLSQSFRGVVGSNQWNSQQNLVEFKHFINHHEWDNLFIKNDVGVLYLTKELQFNDKISAVSLNFDYVDGGTASYVTGWGSLWAWGPTPDNLQKLYVNTISSQECTERVDAEPGWTPPIDPLLEICTLHSPGHGMCHGDSGSALVDLQSRKQIGIVSWGLACARGAPDVYARISGFKEFLEPILQGHY